MNKKSQSPKNAHSQNRRERYSTSVSVLALSVVVTFVASQSAQAANECGVGPSATCTAASYPEGIVYSPGAAAQTVTLDNSNMTATGAISVLGSSAGDMVLNATRFQSVTTSGTASLQATNSGSGSAFVTMDSGSINSANYGGALDLYTRTHSQAQHALS